MKKILVTGATGFQGKPVAEALVKEHFAVRELHSTKHKIETNNQEVVYGDFSDQKSLEQAMNGVDGVYFVLPLLFDRDILLQFTNNFIKAAQVVQPKLIVFNSSIYVPNEPTNIFAFDIKLEIEQLLKRSGLAVIYLHPRVYLDNTATPWSVPAIVNQGVLAYPIAKESEVSWISHYDLARFVAAAFKHPELAGKTFEIGAKKISGIQMAETISKIMNREVAYVPLDPDDFEKGLLPVFGGLAAKGVSDIYRYLSENLSDFQVPEEANKALGVNTLDFKEWASNVPWSLLNEQFAQQV